MCHVPITMAEVQPDAIACVLVPELDDNLSTC